MVIIGNENIDYPEIQVINSILDIKNTKPNSIVIFKFDVEIMKYCKQNSISYGVVINNIKELMLSNSLSANFIIIRNKDKNIQDIADNYMFDAKILTIINNDDEIEDVAKNSIDGVIYQAVIKGL